MLWVWGWVVQPAGDRTFYVTGVIDQWLLKRHHHATTCTETVMDRSVKVTVWAVQPGKLHPKMASPKVEPLSCFCCSPAGRCQIVDSGDRAGHATGSETVGTKRCVKFELGFNQERGQGIVQEQYLHCCSLFHLMELSLPCCLNEVSVSESGCPCTAVEHRQTQEQLGSEKVGRQRVALLQRGDEV